MPAFLLVAAFTGQIAFNASRQDTRYSVTPQIVVMEDCRCQVMLEVRRSGAGGQSTARQRRTVELKARQPTSLPVVKLNIESTDRASIAVAVTSAGKLVSAGQWRVP